MPKRSNARHREQDHYGVGTRETRPHHQERRAGEQECEERGNRRIAQRAPREPRTQRDERRAAQDLQDAQPSFREPDRVGHRLVEQG